MGRTARATTLQQIFDETYITLRDRGWTQAGVPYEDAPASSRLLLCRYRSNLEPSGEPCAAGVHVLDSEYTKQIDGIKAPEDTATGTGLKFVARVLPEFGAWMDAIPDAFSMLIELQGAHDHANGDRMKVALQSVAVKYKLNIPA